MSSFVTASIQAQSQFQSNPQHKPVTIEIFVENKGNPDLAIESSNQIRDVHVHGMVVWLIVDVADAQVGDRENENGDNEVDQSV